MGRLDILLDVMDGWAPDLRAHATRVGGHGLAIARRLGWSDDRLAALRLGAALHDVGKVSMPPEVLAKTGALDEAERAAIQAHPVEGMWLIAGVSDFVPALPYVLFHHERWDGTGYPTRRAGDDIPVEGRVMAVADAYDAMTSDRPYRAALGIGEALAEIERCAGTQFDPQIAEAFLDAVESGAVAA